MRILFDLDGVLADLHTKWLDTYNREWDDDLTVEQLSSYEMHLHVKCHKQVYEIIKRPGFFDDVAPFPEAVAAFRALQLAGHAVRVCSAPAGADSARAKIEWCARELGIHDRHVHLNSEKHWVDADVIIDDSPHVLRQRWPRTRRWTYGGRVVDASVQKICMGYPYNRHMRGQPLEQDGRPGFVSLWADDWQNQSRAWGQVLEYIGKLEKQTEKGDRW